MGVLANCNECGHSQMIGYNPGDGRVQWWTTCESCNEGNFMTPPDPKEVERLIEMIRSVRD